VFWCASYVNAVQANKSAAAAAAAFSLRIPMWYYVVLARLVLEYSADLKLVA
jgi:hypothetical protein